MKTVKTFLVSALVSVVSFSTVSVFAENTGTAASNSMPMMQGQPGNMPMMQGQQGYMPMMQMMQQRHQIMDVHMQKIETHMQNIEELLKQLVESQKK